MDTKIKATLVIVCSDAFPSTKACFESVCSTSKLTEKIIIADNNSGDPAMTGWLNSVDNSSVNGISVQVIFNRENKGFSVAANEAMGFVRSEIVVFAHSDTVFFENSLDNLIISAGMPEKETFAINPSTDNSCSPSFIGLLGRGEHDGIMDCSSYSSIESWVGSYQRSNAKRSRQIFQLSSFVLAMRKSFADRIISADGYLFDVSYGVGPLEDVDLGRRIANIGGKIEACMDSYVRHAGRATWKAKGLDLVKSSVENEKVFRKKWDRKQKVFAVVTAEDAKFLCDCLDKLTQYCDGAFVADISGSRSSVVSKLPKKIRMFVKSVRKGDKKDLRSIKREIKEAAMDLGPDWFIDINSYEFFEEKFGSLLQMLTNPIDLSISSYLMKVFYLCAGGDVYRCDPPFGEKYANALYRADKNSLSDDLNVEGTIFSDIRLKNMQFLNTKLSELPNEPSLKLNCWDEKKEDPTISLVMIVKDETSELERCLKSAIGLWDELIVVWSGTNPQTKQILEKYGAKIVRHKWNGDFSFARNKGLRLAQMKWIFWLDADEHLPVSAAPEWRKILRCCDEVMVAALKVDLDENSNERLRWYFDRAFRNFRNIRFCGKVHEVIKAPKYFKMSAQNCEIYHSGYNCPETNKEKSDRNLKIIKGLLRKGEDVRIPAYYMVLLKAKGDYSGALKIFNSFDGNKKKRKLLSGNFKTISYGCAAECYLKLGKTEEALRCAAEILAENNLISKPYLIMAQAYLDKNLLDNAILSLESVIKICAHGLKYETKYNETKDLVAPFALLACTYLKKGQISNARKYIDILSSLELNNEKADMVISRYREYFGWVKDIPNFDDLIIFPKPVLEGLGKGSEVRQDRLFPLTFKGSAVSARLNMIELG